MSRFDLAFEFMGFNEWGNDEEGGYTNDPHDAGGETRWGVSKRSHPTVDIKNLTKDQAELIYFQQYWEPVKGDDYSDTELAIKVFDCAVNMGVAKAASLLQKAINTFNNNEAVVVDGKLGPKTVAAANDCDPDGLLLFFKDAMIDRYRSIAMKGENSRFLRGWTSRAQRMP